MPAAVNHYESSPTPSRSFPAIKTPPPMEPERRAGAYVFAPSLPEMVEEVSLEVDEGLMALSARIGRLERLMGASSE